MTSLSSPLAVDVTGVGPGDAVFLRPQRLLSPAERTALLEQVRSALYRAHGRDHVVVVVPFGVELEVKPPPQAVEHRPAVTAFAFQTQLPDLVRVRVEASHDRRTGIHLLHVWDGKADIREFASTAVICDLVVKATEEWEHLEGEARALARALHAMEYP